MNPSAMTNSPASWPRIGRNSASPTLTTAPPPRRSPPSSAAPAATRLLDRLLDQAQRLLEINELPAATTEAIHAARKAGRRQQLMIGTAKAPNICNTLRHPAVEVTRAATNVIADLGVIRVRRLTLQRLEASEWGGDQCTS